MRLKVRFEPLVKSNQLSLQGTVIAVASDTGTISASQPKLKSQRLQDTASRATCTPGNTPNTDTC